MIQFKRGKSKNWRENKIPLADGQPGYDKESHKLKIGDGKSDWSELPSASGLFLDEILESEEAAKSKAKVIAAALGPIGSSIVKALKLDDRPVITYGQEAPDDNTIGQLYLQYYDGDPQTDYVVSSGVSGIWRYQKWHSGIAQCWGVLPAKDVSIQTSLGNSILFKDSNVIKSIAYPFTFVEVPSEIATIQGPGNIVWLSNRKGNEKSTSGTYSIISVDKLAGADYFISLQVTGSWK